MIKAACAEIDISPHNKKGVKMAGFAPNKKSIGMMHPLKAGFLYLTDGKEEVCFVTLDLIGLSLLHTSRMRDRVQLNRQERAIICCTHSHAGPDTLGLWGFALFKLFPIKSGIDVGYMMRLEHLIVKTINELKDDGGEPVTFKIAEFETDPSITENARKGGIKEDKGIIIQLIKNNGHPLCTLINFACHPEALWFKNKYLSPDYVHFVREELTSHDTGTPLFFSGALGGMVTVRGADVAKNQKERLELAKNTGISIAKAGLDALHDVQTSKIDSLHVQRKVIHIPVENFNFKLAQRLGLLNREFFNNEIRSEVNLVQLGPLQIVTNPGETLPEVGLQVKDLMTAKYKCIFALGSDELGYILEPEMFKNKEYKYEASMSCGSKTATIMLDAINHLIKTH